MARELGLNPKKLGKIDNHDQRPWKLPLPQFIEHLYLKNLGKERPEVVQSIEDKIRITEKKKAEKREAKLRKKAAESAGAGAASESVRSAKPHNTIKLGGVFALSGSPSD